MTTRTAENGQQITKLPHDESAVSFVGNPGAAAWEQAAQIAADDRYSLQHKQQEMRRLFDAAIADIEERYQAGVNELAVKEAKLKAAARIPFTPTPDDALVMTFIRDELAADTNAELMTRWQEAVESGEALAARAIRGMIQRREKTDAQANNRAWQPSSRYQTLSDKTDDLLSTAEQRKARQELALVENTRRYLSGMHSNTIDKLRKARIGRDGKSIEDTRYNSIGRL